jgi:fructan beta-fructosidase
MVPTHEVVGVNYRAWNIAVLACLVSKAVAAGALLAYEGFDYAAGSPIAGANGGVGWGNAWADVSGNLGESVIAGSLPAGGGAPFGFDARSSGHAVMVNNSSRCGRGLDCSPSGVFAQAGLLNAGGNIGADGKTVYVSFLQQPDSAGCFYEFEFHRDNLGDAGRIAGIGNDVANSTQVYLRAPAGTHTQLGAGNTGVNFYVVRIDFNSGNDDVLVYRNPRSNVEADNEPVLTMTAVADMAFDGLSMGAYLNGVTMKTDEIRVGETWDNVLGDPPTFVLQPANQSLFAGQASALNTLAQSLLPLSYQWYRIAGGGTNALPDKTNATLAIASTQMSDTGLYFVTASNALGVVVSSTAAVAVQPIIVTITGPASVPIEADNELVMRATVNGAEPVSLQWFKDGRPVDGANTETLSWAAASGFEAGQYVLVASNAYGSVTSSIVNAFPNTGGLLAYEGFNYGQSSNDISGRSGGFGWAESWQSLGGGDSLSLSNSLAAGAGAPMGYDGHSSGGNLYLVNNSRKGRYFDCSSTGGFAQRGYLNAKGDLGADGRTLYLSFLQQPDGVSKFYEFELHRDDLGDGGRIGGIGNDTANGEVSWRMQTPPGGTSTFWSLGPGSTNVNFYVLRVDFKPGSDDVTIYRNPTSATEPATATLVLSNVADLSFDGIAFGAYVNSRTVAHDEVRAGMTWADVVGEVRQSQLRLAQRTNNISQLLLTGAPNHTYQLQTATDVVGPWNDSGGVPVSSLGVGQFGETNAGEQRFYRATNSLVWHEPPTADVVLADFEQPTYGAWVTTGTAFGSGPAQGTLPGQQTVSGYEGARLVNSYNGGDTATGTLTSPPFVITKPHLNFLIGGGNLPGQACMNLVISNVVVKTATGANREALIPEQWDVGAYVGQTAVIQIVDSAIGSWGHINVDQITLADAAVDAMPLSRTMLLTNALLNFPVKNGAALRRMTVSVGGNPVRDFDIELADGEPDWWAYTQVSALSNQTATLSVNRLNPGSAGLSSIVQGDGIVGATNLYQERLRPQLHFSSARGWINDANGMFHHGGQYHLYYQHNPYGWNWGNMHWGHAVSPDMVNWRQVMPEGIYPHSYGDAVFSGSAVVDGANTSGFKTGTNEVIVAAYTSTGRGECIAFSNDGGLTFTDYTNNPVVVHNGRDPRLLWYAPSNCWVMALYDETGGGGISFYTSPNLRQWTYRSKINGYFECPDLFQLPVDGDTNNRMWLLCDASGGYQLGQFNGVAFTPATSKLPAHSGSAFYASQTFTRMAPGDGRLVRMAWAQISMPGMPFNQMMYFPTELSLRTTTNGVRLCSTPVAEITHNALVSYVWTNLTLNPGNNPLSGIRGTLFDVQAKFSVGTAQAITFTFQGVTVIYNAVARQISCNGVVNPLAPVGDSIQLEIIADRQTIEIFGNDGQLYMPLPADNPAGSSLISLACTGGNATFHSLTVHKLKSIWSGGGN